MKTSTIATILALALLAPALPLHAQDEPAAGNTIKPWQRDFENLDPAVKQQITDMLVKASALYRQKRIFEALNLLHEIEALHADIPDLQNLKGACYVEFRDFERAREDFIKANELSQGDPDVLFNIAEIAFVTRRWPVAERKFEELSGMIDEERRTQMHRLIDYKLMLIKIKLSKDEEAKALAAKYDHTDDSPYHYFAEAALAYRDGDTDGAELWLARARRVFRESPAMLTAWMDTLIEYGYVKSFYGGDLENASIPTE